MSNILDEYLVKLGAQVDTSSFNELDAALRKASDTIAKSTTGWVAQFAKAGGIVTSALMAIAGAGAGVVMTVAKQDMAMQKYARSMMISTQQAYEMKSALDAMGESAESVAMNPELLGQYQSLVRDARAMTVGGGFGEKQREVRAMINEFTRFKQIVQYALKWIGYYIVKDFLAPLQKGKRTFQELNDGLIKSLPKLTRTIATGFAHVVNIIHSVIRFIGNLYQGFKKIWDAFPDGVKKAIQAISILAAAIASGPVGLLALAIGGVLLLLEDFFAYVDGKESALGPVWQKLIDWWTDFSPVLEDTIDGMKDFFKELQQSERVKKFIDVVKDLVSVYMDLAQTVGETLVDAFQGLWKIFRDLEVPEAFTDAMHDLYDAFLEILKGITNVIKVFKELFKWLTGDPKVIPFWKSVGHIFGEFNKELARTLSTLGKIGKAIGLMLQGKFAEAAALFGFGLQGSDDIDSVTGTAGNISANAVEVIDALKRLGMSENAAIAVAGQMQAESNFTNIAIHDDMGAPAGGLIQWRADRLEALKNFANIRGKSWNDTGVQAEFTVWEMKKNYPDVWWYINDPSHSDADNTRYLTMNYVKPYGHDTEAVWNARTQMTKDVRAKYQEAGGGTMAHSIGNQLRKAKDAAVGLFNPQAYRTPSNYSSGNTSYTSTSGDMNISNLNVYVPNPSADPDTIARGILSSLKEQYKQPSMSPWDIRVQKGPIG